MVKDNIRKMKLKRKVISLGTKIEILDCLRNNERVVDVAKYYSLDEATIRTIKRKEDAIRKSVASGMSTSMSTTSHIRNVIMEYMEKALLIWIEDQNQKRIPIDTLIIKNKALKIYEKLMDNSPSDSQNKVPFNASHGWFERFKQRHSLHNVKLKGEQASADLEAAKQYPDEFAKIIASKSYTPDQVFNADESGLFWKKMPERTFLARHNKSVGGHKAAKDRITILFCSNASGDYMIKPLVINKARQPRSFKGININQLPVYWNANKKAWVTATLFKEWFHGCFVPDVKKYLDKKGLAFKILLVLDNAPGHPKDLQHENVEVVFLPKNTTSVLQPLDQGIISTFKALYIKYAFRYILNQTENEGALSVVDAWKKFNMLDCVKHIGMSYAEIKQSTLHACWKALWPDIIQAHNYRSCLDQEYSHIIGMAHKLGGEGFDDIADVDIAEMMEDQELNEDDLIELIEKNSEIETDGKSNDDGCESSVFTAKVVHDGLVMGKKLGNHFQEYDNNVERGLKFQRDLDKLLSQYDEVHKDMTKNKKQQLISEFFVKSHKTTTNTDTAKK